MCTARRIAADRWRYDFLAVLPLRLERVDIELDVPDGRMTWRQVFSLDHRATARAVVLEDPAPVGMR